MTQQVRSPLPVYSTGTIAANAGSPVVTGNGTAWMIPADNLGNTVNVLMGGDALITAQGAIPIKSVDSATQITLEVALTNSIAAGTPYRVIKYQPNLTGSVISALLTLQAMGSDVSPEASLAIDNGAGRLKMRVAANGDLQLATGPQNTADAALVTAIDITPAGLVTFPAGFGFVDTYRYMAAINAYQTTANAGGVDAMLAFLDANSATGGTNAKRAVNAFIATPGGAFETLVLTYWLTGLTTVTPPGVGLASGAVPGTLAALRQLALQQTPS